VEETARSPGEGIVQAFKLGRVSKAVAVEQILVALHESPITATDTQRRSAFASYLQELDDYEGRIASAGARGLLAAPGGPPPRCAPDELAEEHEEREAEPAPSVGRKRARSTSPGADVTILRKQAPVESLYAWSGRKELGGVLNPNLELTRRMVLNHGTDLKNAKLHLFATPGVPRFPDSEWSNVLLGKAVNLDAVISGAYATQTESQSVEQVGQIELRFGSVKPSKTVQTFGDWTFAFTRTSAAIQFAFPHRAPELSQYAEYILGLFASQRVESHGRIISLDKAIRKFVGASNDIELSNFTAFKWLEISFLSTDGTNHDVDQPRARSRKKGDWTSDNPCRQYNEGRCRRESCRFKHACQRCGGPHAKGECKEAGKRGA
jgi:hypothetical protein